MNKFFFASIFLLAVVTVGINSSSSTSFVFADESNSIREQKLEFAGTLEETLGHFWALEQNLDENNSELALIHATHPISELYETMSEHLQDNPEFDASVQQTLADLQNKANTDVTREDAQSAIEDAKVIISDARELVVGDEQSNDVNFKIQLINQLLETAKVEYKEAVTDGMIVEMAEFQDGSAFVWRSQQIFTEIEEQIDPVYVERVNELYATIWNNFEQRTNSEDVADIIDSIIFEFEELSGFVSKVSEHEEEVFGSDDENAVKDSSDMTKETIIDDSDLMLGVTLLSPLKQMNQEGIEPRYITCKDGLELVFKYNGQPACVKSSSVQKLTNWNWIQ